MTGERACVFSSLIHKLTIVICPIYNERKLYKIISKLNYNIVFLSGKRLMMGVKLGRISPIAFKGLNLLIYLKICLIKLLKLILFFSFLFFDLIFF